MKKYCVAVVLLWLCVTPAFADEGASVGQILAEVKTLSENNQFDEALQRLEIARALEPENTEIRLASARIHSWQGHYDQADEDLRPLLAEQPPNADAELLAANLDYYRGNYDAAETRLQRILDAHPDYTDAAMTLEQVRRAKHAPGGFDWQLDIGMERSSFARQPQPDWSNEYVQLTRLFDKGATAIYARWEYYDQFLTTDIYYEGGAAHRFTPWFVASIFGGHTVNPSFRPTWRVGATGAVRLNEAGESLPAFWITLDAKEDTYNPVEILAINSGLRAELGAWMLAGNMVTVREWGGAATFGWNTRLDGPIIDGLNFYIGYAHAPETQNAVTINTTSIYGGLAYTIIDACTLRFGYTHDDREQSYIRHAFNLGLTYRF